MNADTDQFAAITGEVDELGDDVTRLNHNVSELTETMVRILDLVTPVLRRQVDRERDHNERTVSIRHSGRHRRHRPPPRCGDTW